MSKGKLIKFDTLCLLPFRANKKYDEMRKDHTSEVVVLNTSIKKLTMQVASMQKALEQKVRDCVLWKILVCASLVVLQLVEVGL